MVFSSGQVLTAAGLNGVTLNNIATYTPTVAGGGTVTWTTRTGWYFKIGASKLTYMCAYLVVNAAGNGSSTVTVTAPSSIDRTTRQILGLHAGGGASGVHIGYAWSSTGGSGATLDHLHTANDSGAAGDLVGTDLQTSAIITIQGWYREA